MNHHELFRLKEELLKDLDQRIESEVFESEEEKQKYYNACVDGILEFYTRALKQFAEAA